MKQTSVEWLQVEIDNKDMGEIPMWIYEFIEQAKAMDKQQKGYSEEDMRTAIFKSFLLGYDKAYSNELEDIIIEQFKK